MATLSFLPGMSAALLEVNNKTFWLTPEKDEWEFLFRALAREAELGKAPIKVHPREITDAALGLLKRDYDSRGGKITSKVDLMKVALDI